MKSKEYLFLTLKNYKNSKYNEIHNLMVKLGIIRQLSSGIYSWLPTGKAILDKIFNYIKFEMNKIKCLEMLIPILQSEEIWKNNKKYKIYKSELIITKKVNNKKFILSPTNEEIILYLIKKEINNINLPLKIFQIQSKFRNEIRINKGILRTKEFIMKDAYSFHNSYKCLNNTYNIFKNTYKKIFNKFNIKTFAIKTKNNNGIIKENLSHEFHSISEYGDNKIIICKKTNKAEIFKNSKKIYKHYILTPKENIKYISYNYKSYNYILNKICLEKFIKVFIFYANTNLIKSKFIALAIKFKDSLSINKIKENISSYIRFPIKLASKDDIVKIFKGNVEIIGMLNLKNIPIIIDYNVAILSDFITSININKILIHGLNWNNKFIKIKEVSDISNNNSLKKKLIIKKSIEIAHIFKLNNNIIKTNNGNKKNIFMGSYGIGISRLLFLTIEKNLNINDIKLPYILSPFKISIIPINYYKNKFVYDISNKLYIFLNKKYINNIILENRNISFGKSFKDHYLLGTSTIIIISEKYIKLNLIEIIYKNNKKILQLDFNIILKFIKKHSHM
ncbi:proline--tRNA ligase [endosymbiont of Euscepes postfasciatus]|uniref:proline--tRNA ligase n=1 Tax=endosymbiont of Euscepes postfasciatus TaxID=650377 RepID=UPI000DC717C0|nr:proline--tRNA ligase [endosymbiont of Euscepes postfasciatus]BBA84568.1 proline--tRNA ligase [endosymbiont of Euscepes postfasciatus]